MLEEFYDKEDKNEKKIKSSNVDNVIIIYGVGFS
jgi:hypothetical protein